MPTWIHTEEAAAVTGWSFQIDTPDATTCCTHDGDEAAEGVMTPEVSPSGIEFCVWSSPSKIQMIPNEMRSRRRAAGSG